MESGRQLISLQFGKPTGGQRGGPSVHTHRRVRWSCQGRSHSCPTAVPTAPTFEVAVECQRASGTNNRNFEKTQRFFFFFPLLSTGLSLFQQLSWLRMLSEAGGYGSYWAQATTSSPHAHHSSQSFQRGLCALLYVTCQSIPSYFISLFYVFPYKLYKEQSRLLEEKTPWFSQHIRHTISGQGVFWPTSLTTREKRQIIKTGKKFSWKFF